MLDRMKQDPALTQLARDYDAGQIIFLEGDDSQELYVLSSGEVGIYKGEQKIAAISEPGSIFGEMSFLLGKTRTATVKALTPVQAFRIPRAEIGETLGELGELGREITRILAKRLDDSGRALQGLKELVDQLPEAVVVTDREGRLLTFNAAARELYGDELAALDGRPAGQLYAKPAVFQELLAMVGEKSCGAKRVLELGSPGRGARQVELSLTCLKDAHQRFQGILSLGRDVTAQLRTERRLRRLRLWLLPILILAGAAAAAGVYGIPFLGTPPLVVRTEHRELKTVLGRDFQLLKTMLPRAFQGGDPAEAKSQLAEFFKLLGGEPGLYRGVLLLDRDKRVINAYAPREERAARSLLGTTYARLRFAGDEDSPHKVLVVYRSHPGQAGSVKSLEVACEVREEGRDLGWIVLQLDSAVLEQMYHADEKVLVDLTL